MEEQNIASNGLFNPENNIENTPIVPNNEENYNKIDLLNESLDELSRSVKSSNATFDEDINEIIMQAKENSAAEPTSKGSFILIIVLSIILIVLFIAMAIFASSL